MRPSLVTRLFPLLLAALLFACGGGGSSAPAPAAAPAPVLAALGGTISAPNFAVMDNDVNDPHAPYSENNDFASAQAIGTPAMVGGYATAVATGKAGDVFATKADPLDYYRVTLAAGQSIILSISDYSDTAADPVDLDLYLLDGNDRTVKLSSLGNHGSESITVATSGDYFIEVKAEHGSSNYVMTVGQPQVTGAGEEVPRLEDDFVPGEILVRFVDKAQPAGLSASLHDRAATLGLVGRAGASGRAMRMALPAVGQDGAAGDYRALGASAASGEMRARLDTIRALKRVHGRADVQGVSLNYIRRPSAIPNDPSYPLQWNYPLVNLPQAWEVTTDAAGAVIVAVVDTGVFMAHPDLAANLLTTGYDFIKDKTAAHDGDGIDPDPDDPGDANTPGGSSFHGTHVAGIVAAATNNTLGVAGVCWGTRIMPVRVLGIGGGTVYDVMQGVLYAAGLANDSGTVPPKKADVINLSMGGGGYSSVEQQAFTAVRTQGVIVVASAGNEHSSSLSYPAAYSGVVSVSAVDMNKKQAWYSNYGPTVDVAAPGGDSRVDLDGNGAPDGVYSTLANDASGTRLPTYGYYQGTSMAAPHVAGVAALMKSIYPDLTPDQFDSLLASGAITEDLAANGAAVRDDKYGYGLIDALKAVQQASSLVDGGGIAKPILSVTPNQLDFGLTATPQTVTVSNAGAAGTLTVQDVPPSPSAAWLTVAAVSGSVDTNGVGTYTITVDRTDLVPATYAADITFTSNGGTIILPVVMVQGGQAAAFGNAGFQYIVLIDPLTKATVDTLTATNVQGVYTYSFAGVKPGDYYILAGTDSDNDGLICETGEACGGYPTVDLLQVLTVTDANRDDLDFTTGFSANMGLATPALVEWLGGSSISRLPGKRVGR